MISRGRAATLPPSTPNGGYHGDTGNIEGIIGIIYGE